MKKFEPRKFAELQYQLEGLKNAIVKMETGINNNDVRYLVAEMRYFKEKSERVLNEAQIIIDENYDK